MLDTGRFELRGKANLKAFQLTNGSAKLTLNTLPVIVPNTLDMLLNAEINLEGTDKKSRIEGEIVLVEGGYSKDVNLNLLKGLGKKKRAGAAAPSEIKSPFVNNMVLDIAVKRKNPFVVENNVANLEIHPDLRITGKPINPVISGRATIESGTILYQKKQFEVRKGVIDFLNPYKIEPTLDIESELNIRDWQIILAISGTPDQLNFKLRSEPPEEDGDILSLLLIGKTTKELIAGEGGSSSSTSQILGGLIAATLGKRVKDGTGLDIFELEGAGSDSVKVTMGKKLSKRTTLIYSTEPKEGEMIQRATAEYKFLENILLNGFQDSKGIYGGELQFRLEFR
jgi:autotransporter translocation and assembly factor TamB